jgi:hypothetical protein
MAIPAAQQPVLVGALVVDVTNWQGNWTSRLTEVSTSGTTGTRYAPVRVDPQWTASFPIDTAGYPEALGFTPGAVLAQIAFKYSADKCDIVTVTTIETVQKSSDNNQDVPRVVVTGKGGDITYGQAIPT